MVCGLVVVAGGSFSRLACEPANVLEEKQFLLENHVNSVGPCGFLRGQNLPRSAIFAIMLFLSCSFWSWKDCSVGSVSVHCPGANPNFICSS